jgi:uncharacterized protein YjbI with pentapeptide repeats
VKNVADSAHLEVLGQGVAAWNAWRNEDPFREPDLSGADLTKANLVGANLSGANLSGAQLLWATLCSANLSHANLSDAKLGATDLAGANLSGANLAVANISNANLIRANLSGANLHGANLNLTRFYLADLSRADLSEASLMLATLVDTNLTGADLTGCRVYGASAWKVTLSENTKQQNLIVTDRYEPEITVDNIEVAQFIYLLLHNENIRNVIDTITSKAVLILGRFTDDRKAVLDALRGELRKRDYLPILFDFDKPTGRDITETVSLLARMARFVVADITDAKSIPQELGIIVPDLPSVPVQPLLLEGSGEYSMFEHFRRYPWVLKPYRYESQQQLIGSLADKVIGPAEAKVLELRQPPPG